MKSLFKKPRTKVVTPAPIPQSSRRPLLHCS